MDVAAATAPDHQPVRRRVAARRPGRRVSPLAAAVALILAQLGIRAWVSGSGYFYWDDLILMGRAGTYPLLSSDLLLHNHDGHFMPLAFAVGWVVTKAAPLVWAGPVLSLLVLQLAASVAVWRMLVVLDSAGGGAVPGDAVIGGARSGRIGARVRNAARTTRWVILLPLVFYLFCPLTLPSFAWWSAALNALPLQAALAWVIGDAALLVRTGRRRYAISGTVVFAVGLLFFEKSVVIPFVAFAVAALVGYLDGRPDVLRTVARRGAALWAGSVAVLACWAAAYLSVLDTAAIHSDPGNLWNLLHSATSLGIVPTLLGGPWAWARWLPSTPWAVPPTWTVVIAWIALGALVAVSVRTRVRTAPVWILVVAYVIGVQVSMALLRGGPNTAAELMQSLRYLADVTVVLAAAGALLLRARRRGETAGNRLGRWDFGSAALPIPPRRVRVGRPSGGDSRSDDRGGYRDGHSPARRVAAVAAVLFVASSLWSTTTFVRSWSLSPTRTYLTNLEPTLAAGGAPLLDQEVPWMVLTPLAYPQNLNSRVLSAAAPHAFADSTPDLRMITDTGKVVPAQVWWNRGIRPGPEPGCGYRIDSRAPVELPLDGPLLDNGWTAQLNYFADHDGRIVVGLEHGQPVSVPVQSGLHTAFVRLVGNGSTLRITSRTPELGMCIGVGPVGVASYAR
ncbi:hypothetical protein [Nocardia sp. BMG51109]|uniref:hypothetical protein n=1 Tax=Nocardia sp. BMG51109 TaxID=1056816 RepID=UPI0004ADD45A|nr:hypothetical protein [Nocardia sp. BMG51109]